VPFVSAAVTIAPTTFAALGEPSRLRIVELLRRGPLSVGEIVETLGIRQPQVSKHLRVLGESGIVTVEPHQRYRIYRLQPAQFEAVADWVDSFERLWDARLDSLGTFLHALDPERHDHGEPADR
jgi:DNA-binding transcriptional ArsR family regulator